MPFPLRGRHFLIDWVVSLSRVFIGHLPCARDCAKCWDTAATRTNVLPRMYPTAKETDVDKMITSVKIGCHYEASQSVMGARKRKTKG